MVGNVILLEYSKGIVLGMWTLSECQAIYNAV